MLSCEASEQCFREICKGLHQPWSNLTEKKSCWTEKTSLDRKKLHALTGWKGRIFRAASNAFFALRNGYY